MDMEDKEFHEARPRVRAFRGFYAHLFTYIGVNLILLVLNLITAPFNLWFYWVALFWGIGLVFHAFDVYTVWAQYLRQEEERRIMEEERRRAA